MKTERQSNFELLRIIAILLIIMGHFGTQGFDATKLGGINGALCVFFSSGSRIAVNLFLMIGVWFMVDSDFIAKRVLVLYGSLWIYVTVITGILWLMGYEIGIKNILNFVLPFMTKALWYITVYISLLFLHPFIKNIFNLERVKIKKLLMIGFLLIVIMSTALPFMDTYLCALVWFVYMYIFIGYYKKFLYDAIKDGSKNYYILLGLIIYILLVAIRLILLSSDNGIFALGSKIVSKFLLDYKSLPNFLCAICVFVYFSKINIGYKKIINELSQNTLDIYIIHQIPYFYPVLWRDICKVDCWINSKYVFVYFICITILIYIVLSLIGRLRKALIEPLWIKCKLYRLLENRINRFYDFDNDYGKDKLVK